MMVFDDPQSGREVLLRFNDKTMLSVVMETATTVAGKLYRNDGVMMQVLSARSDKLLIRP